MQIEKKTVQLCSILLWLDCSGWRCNHNMGWCVYVCVCCASEWNTFPIQLNANVPPKTTLI